MQGDHLAILRNARELPQRVPARDLDTRAGTIELAIPGLRTAAMCVASRCSMASRLSRGDPLLAALAVQETCALVPR
jgi:hypothetical protein